MIQATERRDRLIRRATALIKEVRRQFPDALRLAKIISLASRVEPELLRKARLELLPEVDAGAEADLWLSPIIQSENALGLVLLPEVEESLRQELSDEPQLLERTWEVLKEFHRNAPPVTRLEEEITWLALSKNSDASAQIEHRLQEVIVAMVNENRRGLASWAAHALPRLPEAARKTNAAWMLAIGAGARLGGRQILKGEPHIKATESWLRWILPEDIQHILVGVRLLEGRVEFGDPSMPGAHAIELPKTNPLLVEISWEERGNRSIKQVVLQIGQSQTIEVSTGPISVLTALGVIYTLHPGPDSLRTRRSPRLVKELPELERWIQKDLEEDAPKILSMRNTLDEGSGSYENERSLKDVVIEKAFPNLGMRIDESQRDVL